MNWDNQMLTTEPYEMRWQRLFFQGSIILILGTILALASIFNPTVTIISTNELSLLPISGILLLTLGLFECLEAKMTKTAREFHQNLQVGILDTVVGALLLLSIAENLLRFSMLLAAFLITRGSVRIVMVFTLQLPCKGPTAFAGVVSIILGLMMWQQWPIYEGWFLSLCINIEIIFRGWAMMMFSLWIRKQKVTST